MSILSNRDIGKDFKIFNTMRIYGIKNGKDKPVRNVIQDVRSGY
jgi:hypothetical protein